jgi:hypothetical protein
VWVTDPDGTPIPRLRDWGTIARELATTATSTHTPAGAPAQLDTDVTAYDALQEHLRSSPDHELTMSFAEVEKLVGPLPPSARRPGAWWINDPERNARASVWLLGGE